MTSDRAVSYVGRKLLVAATPLLLAAPPVQAADNPCQAQAWAEYNRCLVQNCGYFDKILCDAAFMLDQAACVLGGIQ